MVVVVVVVVVMVATVVALVVVVVAVDAHWQSHERKLIARGCGCRHVQVVVAVVVVVVVVVVSGLTHKAKPLTQLDCAWVQASVKVFRPKR